jgi:hypothetical protein
MCNWAISCGSLFYANPATSPYSFPISPTANVGFYSGYTPPNQTAYKKFPQRFFREDFSALELSAPVNYFFKGFSEKHYQKYAVRLGGITVESFLTGLIVWYFSKALLVRIYHRAFCLYSVRPANLSGKRAVFPKRGNSYQKCPTQDPPKALSKSKRLSTAGHAPVISGSPSDHLPVVRRHDEINPRSLNDK